jgi:hypothetical protein
MGRSDEERPWGAILGEELPAAERFENVASNKPVEGRSAAGSSKPLLHHVLLISCSLDRKTS